MNTRITDDHERVYETPLPGERLEVARDAHVERSWLSGPNPVLALLGLFLLIIGGLAAARTDFSGTYNQPVRSVLGWSHTPLLAWLEMGAGLLLIIAAAIRGGTGRALTLLVGAAVVVCAFMGIADNTGIQDELALESGHAWALLLVGIVSITLALLPARRTRTRVDRTVVDRPLPGRY